MVTQSIENGMMTIVTPRHHSVLPSPVHSFPRGLVLTPRERRDGAGLRDALQGVSVFRLTLPRTARVRDVCQVLQGETQVFLC